LLNNFFSKTSIQSITPEIQKLVSKLMGRFQQALAECTVVQLDDAFSAFTTDVITYYSYGKSWNYLEHVNYQREIREAISEMSDTVHINRFFPWLPRLLRRLPKRVTRWMKPGVFGVFERIAIIANQSAISHERNNADLKDLDRTIFNALNDPSVPAEERTIIRLQDEGLLVLAAGTETITNALALAAFHLYSNKTILQKLRQEIQQVMPDPDSPAPWLQLEQLPYMVCRSHFQSSPPLNQIQRVLLD
jgi:cytochrome P450